MWSRLKLDSPLLTRSRSRSLVGPPDPFFIRFGRALFLFGSRLLYHWISSFKDLTQSRFELWFDLDGRWQRKRSDNRGYVPSVEERKWKFWDFPQWLAEALFVIIDASEQRIMMPGICSQRKKRSLPQMDQTSMFHTKIDLFSCHIPCVSTDFSALPKKAVWSKVGMKSKALSSLSEDDLLIASPNQGLKSELTIWRKLYDWAADLLTRLKKNGRALPPAKDFVGWNKSTISCFTKGVLSMCQNRYSTTTPKSRTRTGKNGPACWLTITCLLTGWLGSCLESLFRWRAVTMAPS